MLIVLEYILEIFYIENKKSQFMGISYDIEVVYIKNKNFKSQGINLIFDTRNIR